jgi:hypothetical protein
MYLRTLKETVIELNSKFKTHGSLVQFKEKELNHSLSNLDSEKLSDYVNIHSFLNSLTARQLNEIFILLEIKHLEFSSTDIEIMTLEANQFRRKFYQKLLQESKSVNIPLNSDFCSVIRNKYSHRWTAHKNAVKLSDSDIEMLTSKVGNDSYILSSEEDNPENDSF